MKPIIAFAHIPKTAGTTLISILRRSYGWRHFDRPGFYRPLTADDLKQIRKVYRGLASIAGHTIQPHTDLHEQHPIRYYTFLRDPAKRLVSEFKFYLRRSAYDGNVHENLEASWNTWLPTRSNYQCRYLSNEESAEKALEIIQDRIPFIGLLERFDESLLLFRKWADDPRLDIHYTTLNKGDGGSEHGRVTDEHIRDIDRFCKEL
uniref:sulfotransferase family 2 domain-containing protein n=1 Tax=Pontiella sp. TaxID=2837462 RepID=UPI0035697D39